MSTSDVENTLEVAQVTPGAGPEAVEAAYRDVLDGRTAGSTGHSLTMWTGD